MSGSFAHPPRPRRAAPNFETLEARLALAAPQFESGTILGNVESNAVVAASGLIASRGNMDVLWSFNDSGDSRLFAMNLRGRHLGTFTTGVPAVDWEDVAIGPGPAAGVDYLYVADTGDNGESRADVVVYRVREPAVSSMQTPTTQNLTGVAALRFRYPDGPHDAETLIVDPANGDIYIITKRDARSRIFLATYPQSTTSTTTLSAVGMLTWGSAAGGDISLDGDELILKDLDDVFYYARPNGTTIAQALAVAPMMLPYTTQQLGEGLTFDAHGVDYFTNSEGSHQPLYYYERVRALAGDVNGDERVDAHDSIDLVRRLGMATGAIRSQGDVSGDGRVSLTDLAIVQSSFGASVSSPAFAPAAALTLTTLSDVQPMLHGTKGDSSAARQTRQSSSSERSLDPVVADLAITDRVQANARRLYAVRRIGRASP